MRGSIVGKGNPGPIPTILTGKFMPAMFIFICSKALWIESAKKKMITFFLRDASPAAILIKFCYIPLHLKNAYYFLYL